MAHQHNAHMLALYRHRVATYAARQREAAKIQPATWWECLLAVFILLPWTILTGSGRI